MQKILNILSNFGIINIITILACAFIIATFVCTWRYVSSKGKTEIMKNRQWIEQLPSLLSTFGVFGTFIGITVGLYFFKPDSLESSIIDLLDGLRTAFVTSLLGMACSLILNRKVSTIFDGITDEESETVKSARKIADAINQLQTTNETLLKEILRVDKEIKTVSDNQDTKLFKGNEKLNLIMVSIDQIRDDVEEIKGSHELIRETQNEILTGINNLAKNDSTAEEVRKLKAVALTATANIATIDNAVSDITETSKTTSEKLTQLVEYVEEQNDRKR